MEVSTTSRLRYDELGRQIAALLLCAVAVWVIACTSHPRPTISLIDAVKQGNVDQVDANLYWGTDVNALDSNGLSSLHYAAADGRAQITRMLLKAGANVNVREAGEGATPLLMAVMRGDFDTVNALIKAGADVRAWAQGGLTPMLIAVSEGFMRIDAKDENTKFAEVEKALNEKAAIVKALCDAGADVNEVHQGGFTPLFGAVSNSLTSDKTPLALVKAAEASVKSVVQVLIDRGAKVDASDDRGNTPLHYAAESGNSSGIQALLAAKANLNAQNKMGETPLSKAANHGNIDAVKAFLDAGANADTARFVGGTPAQRNEIAAVLRAHGAHGP